MAENTLIIRVVVDKKRDHWVSLWIASFNFIDAGKYFSSWQTRAAEMPPLRITCSNLPDDRYIHELSMRSHARVHLAIWVVSLQHSFAYLSLGSKLWDCWWLRLCWCLYRLSNGEIWKPLYIAVLNHSDYLQTKRCSLYESYQAYSCESYSQGWPCLYPLHDQYARLHSKV